MKERAFIRGLSIIALTCALSMFYVMHQIWLTSDTLQSDRVDVINFPMLNDHHANRLAHALLAYQRALRSGQNAAVHEELAQACIERFGILHKAFRGSSGNSLPEGGDEPPVKAIIAAGHGFVDRFEPPMSIDVTLTDRQLGTMVDAAIDLSQQLNALGRSHYRQASALRDATTTRLDQLNNAFWFFGCMLLAAGIVLSLLLLRATRRMAQSNVRALSSQAQLDKALDELTSGDNERRAQNRFIAAASHDLRQPLHALGLYLGALRGHVSSADGRAILESTHRSTEALTQLLNSLLDISRLDAGVVDIQEQPFALDDLLQQLHQTFLPEALDRELTLAFTPCGLWVDTDHVLLDRILRNLISNALNYTHAGSVTIEAIASADSVLVRVTDTGLGIPPIEQEAIFNEYYQLHNPERDRTKGLGLGLSIVRRLTRLLDVELRVDSIEGQGTRFELVLPPARAMQANIRHDADGHDQSGSERVRGLTVLVIDDEMDVRDGMQLLLGLEGCEVIPADDAEHAVNALIDRDIVPDLIIADYRLRNDQTGSHAIVSVREEVNEDIPAMIITGDTSPARLKEAKASGFPLLHKPVATDELFAALRALVNR